ncbi:MAG: sodium:proton antiporter NhaD [Gammaproteobacteria bacterium]|nr:sodium:proton antiporter NhaD [Gammaproteobacteria bacterium]NND39357.1 sodium:proton antiporter NhaD [Pseudomonadales bacterium]MBT8151305.1 sodium:proton antiporter NhaD [Gammaproteobacteria bacterium]NNL10450.1 sodium:proton antiporter NhaD [Pseudomonadales bacterium]NNM10504.1 sodium:proton antiporter NhaD [Pseudomonadales bacterium]
MQTLDLTRHWVGYLSVVIFFIAYLLVAMEEKIHLRKSKPVMLAAGLIWVAIAVIYSQHNIDHTVHEAIEETFIEYARLFFFLLVAMTYISALLERGVFEALRNWLVTQGFGYKSLFWITGALAFIISPVADNLTTALIMCAVVLVVGAGNDKFIAIACINIVVAANAGGAFSPFGDITTLMVWQKGVVEFREFFALFIPSLVNFLLPAAIMYLAIPEGRPTSAGLMQNPLKVGGIAILILFFLTIATAVSFHNFLHIPPVFGMMLGLAYLKLFGFYLLRKSPTWSTEVENPPASEDDPYDFDVFARIAQAEWDTLFFFYGVIMAVGGLGFIGYLELLSSYMYGELGALNANILVGILSAFVDNIPVMFAVLTMQPDMPHVQWLLVTLTAGVGGSLLSIGSAAGVALMGQARGKYTFFTHLRWTPVIALGYFASIYVHLLING